MNQRGVTLIELLIALLVFTLVSGAAVAIMRLSVSGQDRLVEVTEEMGELERFRAILRNDLSQAMNRPYHESNSALIVSPFLGGLPAESTIEQAEDERVLMALVRNGWVNPGAVEPRASVQHVTYLMKEDNLIRRTRPFLDAVDETPTRDQILIENIPDLALLFHSGRDWLPDWSPRQNQLAPIAVRIEGSFGHYGYLTQDFLVGGAP